MRKMPVVLLVAMLLASAPVLAAKPIMNLEGKPVPVKVDGSAYSLNEVQTAITSACKLRKWTPVIETDSVVVCSIVVRGRHFAEVEIPFSTESYSILYRSSDNLDYNEKKQRIHRNYNNWVINLARAIDSTLSSSN